MKDLAEVCSLSREGVPLSIPLQDGLCFLRIPLPTAPLGDLAAPYP
jgi:hypothetical protein